MTLLEVSTQLLNKISQAYLILAVVLGAGIGHYYLGSQIELDSATQDKGMACH